MWVPRSSSIRNVLATAVALQISIASAFYLPGVAPTDYDYGELVQLNVNRLTPTIQFAEPGSSIKDSNIRSLISYDYYHAPFRFCKPQPDGPKKISESLGSILFGDRILTSPFELKMGENETCKLLCQTKFDKRDAKFVNKRIFQGYNINWLIDGLPAATRKVESREEHTYFYSQGFALGGLDEVGDKLEPTFHNHYDIFVDFHEIPNRTKKKYRVVGVVVQPSSKTQKASSDGKTADCTNTQHIRLFEDKETSVAFTYSVRWRPSPTAWATRWDKYLHVVNPRVHWFSLVNSAIIVIFSTGMVAAILLKTLRKDIARYNQLDLNEDVSEDSGWKLVHGDVFRAPKNPMLLSIFLGSGAQIFFMTAITISMSSTLPLQSAVMTN